MLTRSLLRIAALIIAAIAIHRFCVVPYRDNLLVGEVARRSALAQNADPAQAMSLATTNIHELDMAEEPVAAGTQLQNNAGLVTSAAGTDVIARVQWNARDGELFTESGVRLLDRG